MADTSRRDDAAAAAAPRATRAGADTTFFTNIRENESSACGRTGRRELEEIEEPIVPEHASRAKSQLPKTSARSTQPAMSTGANGSGLLVQQVDGAPFTAATDGLATPSTTRTTGRPHPHMSKSKNNVSFVHGLKRTVTGGPLSRSQSQAYSYVFDPMPPDNSDSSSSSDDEATIRRRRRPHAGNDQHLDKQDRKLERKNANRGMSYSQFKFGNEHMNTQGRVSKRDGRLNIAVNDTASRGYVAKALGHTIKNHLDIPQRTHSSAPWQKHTRDHASPQPDTFRDDESITEGLSAYERRPKMNIVIMVIGSRGDIQPFLKVGKILSQKHGHRVRIATHPAFRDFVQKDAGLEFFSVGGDPAELMAFMVKNPGLMPGLQTFRNGEIKRRRDQMAEMFDGFWRACINATDDEHDPKNKQLLDKAHPFVADAIIANPPSFAHVHIAERLGIPLHMMFTFPYTPTTQFPHPLANIKPNKSNVDLQYVNFMSYALVEMMTWQGLGDLVNDLRTKTLGLEPVSSLWAPGALYRMKVPYTYMWSPSLVPKPADWGPEIDLAGFAFLDLASSYDPPSDLSAFLDAGEAPVYIGFGSIVIDDPENFTHMIFEAVKRAGVRALINKGWGGIGGEGSDVPENVFMINNVPHDWLFPRVKAVIHHGGAGTTAIGLKCGKPTMIVPFFGDQPFWGAMVAEAKAGAFECIPYKKLTVERFAEGIKQCLTEEARENVAHIAESIEKEGNGAENAVKSFHRNLPLAGRHNMRCSILEDRVAVWKLRNSSLRLSSLAAELLVEQGKVKWHDLKLIKNHEWNDFDGPGEPITGTTGAVTSSLFDIGEGVGMVPVRIAKHIKHREAHDKKKKAIAERKARRAAQKQNEKVVAKTAPTDGEDRPHTKRLETNNTLTSVISEDPTAPLYQELADDVATGIAKSSYALVNLPLNLSLATARGFHNAPRLYGDATVRRPVKITGVKSGFKAAGNELGYGVYDAWTGLVTQPKGGWSDEVTLPRKFAGLGKGAAKGAGGFVLKNISAIIAPPVYVSLGVRKYLEKRIGGPGTTAFIKQSRVLQGKIDEDNLSKHGTDKQLASCKAEVEAGWSTYQEIWATAEQIKLRSKAKPVAGFRYARERKQWIESGMLENVRSVRAALEAHKSGQDLDKFAVQRRHEAEEAEKLPATPVVELGNADDADDAGTAGTAEHATDNKLNLEQNTAETMPDGIKSDNTTHLDRGLEGRLREVRADSDATAVEPSLSFDDKHVDSVPKTNDYFGQAALGRHTGVAGGGLLSS